MRSTRFILQVLIIILAFAITACGTKQPEEKQQSEAVIVYNLGTEPKTLDPAKASGKPEMTVLAALFDGLVRYNKNNELIKGSGMAVDWTVSPDGLKYVFKLRQDAKWSNGDPVTANDFEFAWKRLLAPETGAEYAYQLFYLKNGQKYHEGKVTADQVGVRAINSYTLEVELEFPTPYFIALTATTNLVPLNRKVVEANPDWHSAVETYVSNGPFSLASWQHHQRLVLKKNPTYWDASSVNLDKLIITMVESRDTELIMFQNNEIDIGENPPLQEMRRLISEGVATVTTDPSTYYYIFNTAKPPFNDVRVRKALAYAIDRKAITENVLQAGQKPALAFVPYGFSDGGPGKDFRKIGGNYFKDNDVSKARALLAEAGYPGGAGFPEIEFLYNTNESHKKIAEAIAHMWKENLGIRVRLINQEWGVYLNNRFQGNFQLTWSGWGPDYPDPMTFLNVYVSDGGHNETNWGSPQYDELINRARKSGNNIERFAYMHEAEKILMDEMPIMPIYFYVNVTLYKPWVKGVFSPTFGPMQEFKWASVKK
ncbi:MAG: peptide ABC transporter substrate-binding protein [Syntrophomonadaceae bacterium]|nr:peptide ABC transporter substrate-binding protein [Syntrophomonadaceae bacterium]